MTPTPELETVAKTASAASVINHIKSNRIEYALCVIALHLLGVSDRLLGELSGVCL